MDILKLYESTLNEARVGWQGTEINTVSEFIESDLWKETENKFKSTLEDFYKGPFENLFPKIEYKQSKGMGTTLTFSWYLYYNGRKAYNKDYVKACMDEAKDYVIFKADSEDIKAEKKAKREALRSKLDDIVKSIGGKPVQGKMTVFTSTYIGTPWVNIHMDLKDVLGRKDKGPELSANGQEWLDFAKSNAAWAEKSARESSSKTASSKTLKENFAQYNLENIQINLDGLTNEEVYDVSEMLSVILEENYNSNYGEIFEKRFGEYYKSYLTQHPDLDKYELSKIGYDDPAHIYATRKLISQMEPCLYDEWVEDFEQEAMDNPTWEPLYHKVFVRR